MAFTILVGTDFSSHSEKALAMAYHIAKQEKAQLHLLHVLEPVDDPNSSDPETRDFYSQLEAQSQANLQQAIAPYQDDSVQIFTETRVGPRDATLLEAASELEVQLIVLGSRPIDPSAWRMGTSHRVAVTSSIPVLLVP